MSLADFYKARAQVRGHMRQGHYVRPHIREVGGELRGTEINRDGYDKLVAMLEEGATVPSSGYHGPSGGPPVTVMRRPEEGKPPRLVDVVKNRFYNLEEVEGTVRPPTHLWRGVSEQEWAQIQKDGYILSDKRGVIEDREGTNFADDPRSAISYLPRDKGFNEEAKGLGRVIRVKYDDADGYFMMEADGYVRTQQPVPIERIDLISPVIYKDEHTYLSIPDTFEKGRVESHLRSGVFVNSYLRATPPTPSKAEAWAGRYTPYVQAELARKLPPNQDLDLSRAYGEWVYMEGCMGIRNAAHKLLQGKDESKVFAEADNIHHGTFAAKYLEAIADPASDKRLLYNREDGPMGDTTEGNVAGIAMRELYRGVDSGDDGPRKSNPRWRELKPGDDVDLDLVATSPSKSFAKGFMEDVMLVIKPGAKVVTGEDPYFEAITSGRFRVVDVSKPEPPVQTGGVGSARDRMASYYGDHQEATVITLEQVGVWDYHHKTEFMEKAERKIMRLPASEYSPTELREDLDGPIARAIQKSKVKVSGYVRSDGSVVAPYYAERGGQQREDDPPEDPEEAKDRALVAKYCKIINKADIIDARTPLDEQIAKVRKFTDAQDSFFAGTKAGWSVFSPREFMKEVQYWQDAEYTRTRKAAEEIALRAWNPLEAEYPSDMPGMRAATLMGWVNRAPEIDKTLYRGISLFRSQAQGLKPGDTFDDPLGSWSADEMVARMVGGDRTKGGKETVVFEVERPKAIFISPLDAVDSPYRLTAREYMSGGRYEILSVEKRTVPRAELARLGLWRESVRGETIDVTYVKARQLGTFSEEGKGLVRKAEQHHGFLIPANQAGLWEHQEKALGEFLKAKVKVKGYVTRSGKVVPSYYAERRGKPKSMEPEADPRSPEERKKADANTAKVYEMNKARIIRAFNDSPAAAHMSKEARQEKVRELKESWKHHDERAKGTDPAKAKRIMERHYELKDKLADAIQRRNDAEHEYRQLWHPYDVAMMAGSVGERHAFDLNAHRAKYPDASPVILNEIYEGRFTSVSPHAMQMAKLMVSGDNIVPMVSIGGHNAPEWLTAIQAAYKAGGKDRAEVEAMFKQAKDFKAKDDEVNKLQTAYDDARRDFDMYLNSQIGPTSDRYRANLPMGHDQGLITAVKRQNVLDTSDMLMANFEKFGLTPDDIPGVRPEFGGTFIGVYKDTAYTTGWEIDGRAWQSYDAMRYGSEAKRDREDFPTDNSKRLAERWDQEIVAQEPYVRLADRTPTYRADYERGLKRLDGVYIDTSSQTFEYLKGYILDHSSPSGYQDIPRAMKTLHERAENGGLTRWDLQFLQGMERRIATLGAIDKDPSLMAAAIRGHVEDRANIVQHQWAMTAGDSDETSQRIQRLASEEFDRGATWQHMKEWRDARLVDGIAQGLLGPDENMADVGSKLRADAKVMLDHYYEMGDAYHSRVLDMTAPIDERPATRLDMDLAEMGYISNPNIAPQFAGLSGQPYKDKMISDIIHGQFREHNKGEAVKAIMGGMEQAPTDKLDRAILRSQYVVTQQALAKKGLKPYDRIQLYRASSEQRTDGRVVSWDKVSGGRAEHTARTNPLSSWAQNISATDTFGRNKAAASVPVKDIFSTATTGSGCLGENEVIILGGDYPAIFFGG